MKLDALEEPLRARCVAPRIAAQRVFQLTNELALCGAELHRRFNHHAAEKIPAGSATPMAAIASARLCVSATA